MEDTPQENSYAIRYWAEADRPREKLMTKGRSVLTEAELIAILLGSGTRSLSALDVAKNILNAVNNDLNSLAKFSVKDLMKFKGIGEAKAIGIVAAVELGRRRREAEVVMKPKIASSLSAYELLKPHLWDLPHEEFWVIFLNRANQLIAMKQISSGGIAGTVADVRLIFKQALDYLASNVILAHNHPSGNREPSQADILLTKKMKEAGQLLEIAVLDHIIFVEHNYFSFADEALM